jgi:hypothetical protein
LHNFKAAIEPGSVAMRTGHLHDYVSLIAINGTRVDSMTHQAIFDHFLICNLMPLKEYFKKLLNLQVISKLFSGNCAICSCCW